MTSFETKLREFIDDLQDFYDSGQVNPYPSLVLDFDELSEAHLERLHYIHYWTEEREDNETYDDYWSRLEEEYP